MSLPELQQNPLVQRVIDIFDTDGNGEVDFQGKHGLVLTLFYVCSVDGSSATHTGHDISGAVDEAASRWQEPLNHLQLLHFCHFHECFTDKLNHVWRFL